MIGRWNAIRKDSGKRGGERGGVEGGVNGAGRVNKQGEEAGCRRWGKGSGMYRGKERKEWRGRID
ncbi:MAG: hypothetical protein LC655_03380, partial [Bacteroidales bacterium]|nr:hypothetical protein [Bacteroidales bacterium]